jgi:hypothetical protein
VIGDGDNCHCTVSRIKLNGDGDGDERIRPMRMTAPSCRSGRSPRRAPYSCYLIYPTPTVLCSISSDPETGCAARIAPRGLVSLPSPSVCPALPRREGRAFLLAAGFLHRCAVAWFMAGYAGLHSTDVPCRRQVWICRETSWTCTAGNDTV